MPIYEYTCGECRHDFEELVLSSREKVVCPKCGSGKVERAMSVFAFSNGNTFRSTGSSDCSGCSKGSCAGCGGG